MHGPKRCYHLGAILEYEDHLVLLRQEADRLQLPSVGIGAVIGAHINFPVKANVFGQPYDRFVPGALRPGSDVKNHVTALLKDEGQAAERQGGIAQTVIEEGVPVGSLFAYVMPPPPGVGQHPVDVEYRYPIVGRDRS